MGGTPAWSILTENLKYYIHAVYPDHWYDGFIESDQLSTAVYIVFPPSFAPDVSNWFNPGLFPVQDYNLPELLADRDAESRTVIINREDAKGTKIATYQTYLMWSALAEDGAKAIFDHYVESLADHDWLDQKDLGQFKNVFARLDQNRSITIRTQPDGSDGSSMMCIIEVDFFPED